MSLSPNSVGDLMTWLMGTSSALMLVDLIPALFLATTTASLSVVEGERVTFITVSLFRSKAIVLGS